MASQAETAGGSAFPALLCSWVRPSASVRRCAMRLRPLSPRNDWLPWASSLSPAAGAGMWSHWPVSPWGPRNGETEGPGSRRGRIRLEGSSPDRSRGRQVHSRLPSPLRSETSASQQLSAHGARYRVSPVVAASAQIGLIPQVVNTFNANERKPRS